MRLTLQRLVFSFALSALFFSMFPPPLFATQTERSAGFSARGWVTSFYVAYWGRSPDPEGLNYWINKIDNGTLSPAQVAENFALSAEAKAMYPYLAAGGAVDHAQVDEFIRSLYANLLNRSLPSNDTGVLYWVGELRNNRTTPGGVIGNIINAAMVAGTQDWETIRNKVDVADYFARRFTALGRAWHAGDYGRARRCLNNVTREGQTVTRGRQIVDQLLAQGVLVIEPPVPGGPVAGTYRLPGSGLGAGTEFTVSAQGVAVFQTQGTAPGTGVSSQITAENEVTVVLPGGVTLDGKGPLTPDERQALQAVFNGPLADDLALIALEAGCLPAGSIQPNQLAALLAPWQLALKYLYPDRVARVADLVARNSCDYFGEFGDSRPLLITLSASAPIPVVFGYFPFDREGAAENESSRSGSSGTQDCGLIQKTRVRTILDNPNTRRDEYGTCTSKCRGACGPDCIRTNCGAPQEVWECLKDHSGINSGDKTRWDVYSCGVHPGCITHDACYDRVNGIGGCGSWDAVFLRHDYTWGDCSQWQSCDGEAICVYGISQAVRWASGFGPFSDTWVFAYSDRTSTTYDVQACPPIDCGEEGTFTCANGQVICADLVCNSRDDCGDNSDESRSFCGDPNSCCVATNGCPGETATSCAETCCCCPYGQICDQSNHANGCVSVR